MFHAVTIEYASCSHFQVLWWWRKATPESVTGFIQPRLPPNWVTTGKPPSFKWLLRLLATAVPVGFAFVYPFMNDLSYTHMKSQVINFNYLDKNLKLLTKSFQISCHHGITSIHSEGCYSVWNLKCIFKSQLLPAFTSDLVPVFSSIFSYTS